MDNINKYIFIAIVIFIVFYILTNFFYYENFITILNNELELGNDDNSEIPNIIWSFWEGDKMDVVEKCMESWQFYNPKYKINIINKKNFNDYIDIDFENIKHIQNTNAIFSDFVRLNILSKYGGIWIDASIICHKPFTWLHKIQNTKNVDVIGYYIPLFTIDKYLNYSPVIESWFFACKPNSIFVNDWLNEFMRTTKYNDLNDYIKNIKDEGIDLQKINNPIYLVIHSTAQAILQRNKDKYKICLFNAETGPFQYNVEVNWDLVPCLDNLTNEQKNKRFFDFPIIKLRHGERHGLEDHPKKDNAFSHIYLKRLNT
jgi:hypothetical protein